MSRENAEVELAVELEDGVLMPLSESNMKIKVQVVRMDDKSKSVDQVSMIWEIANALNNIGPDLARGLNRRWPF